MSAIKWKRQDDGSYTSEAGRVRRCDIIDQPKSWCRWLAMPAVPNEFERGTDTLAEGRADCESAHRRYQFATMPAPPASEILAAVIARMERDALHPSRIPSLVALEALRACQHLVGLPPGLADALVAQWREEQAAERRRLRL